MKSKAFAGLGAYKTPNTPEYPIGAIMTKTSYMLSMQRNWCMTSGGQEGGDTFFQEGLQVEGRDAIDEGLFKLFLPSLALNNQQRGILIHSDDMLSRARKILIEHKVYANVPRFMSLEGMAREALTDRERDMAARHTQRVFQVLQETLDNPVNMVICWTPDGAISRAEFQVDKTGGTGIAICLADALGIPVFNLQRKDHLGRICEFIGEPMPNISQNFQ